MIYLVIYLLGCIVSYLLGKKSYIKSVCKEDREDYTTNDRANVLSLASLSWLTVIVFSIELLGNLGSKDKRAKW